MQARAFVILGTLCAMATPCVAQAQLVAPGAYQSLDASYRVWVPGASEDVRQQTLVGASHLTAIVGHSITGIAFRRTAKNEAFPGGAAQMTVRLSTSPRTPTTCSSLYADNVGVDAVEVFQGTVTIPASPADLGPNVAWSANNVIQMAFTQPFAYQGGTLCVDITGTTVSGQTVDWWLADAAFDFAAGTTVDLGPGCGPHSNAQGQWSWVEARTLLPGSTADMSAIGDAGNFVVAVVGDPGPAVPLALVGLGQPGCNAYLSSVLMLNVRQFVAFGDPRMANLGGLAELKLPIPNEPWVLGVQAVTQWLDLIALHSSNAVLWTIGTQQPTLDMALVDGVPSDVGGNATPFMAHVLRFDYQ